MEPKVVAKISGIEELQEDGWGEFIRQLERDEINRSGMMEMGDSLYVYLPRVEGHLSFSCPSIITNQELVLELPEEFKFSSGNEPSATVICGVDGRKLPYYMQDRNCPNKVYFLGKELVEVSVSMAKGDLEIAAYVSKWYFEEAGRKIWVRSQACPELAKVISVSDIFWNAEFYGNALKAAVAKLFYPEAKLPYYCANKFVIEH